ncbi:uncharacterized protein F4807DRAFT_274513 [Annulohypoxylon truncatum]|uniref:uncharacterized protein n=1 Tax=Annulohypoxylon truncatum TaxID=327061 RepID=UPI002007C120|nr:uncharacterized protein F4807DRAFT_274513 [Annulohypoxylon truncatum]KAI1205760.1 hypothetical protein F4807DRAFT_274513 [Annulohypoxylon truncatum]
MDQRDGSDFIPSGSNSSADEHERPRPKRRRRPTSPPSSSAPVPAPKRQKPAFNPRYLRLLNSDITDTASGLLLTDPAPTTLPLLDLEPTQLGAVSWAVPEKQSFFAALARLGRDDVSGIASRIGSKSALEVRQYLYHLDAADRARRAGSKRRRGIGPLAMPAAAELGAELTAALDGAADALALRQEVYEASLEQKRWGGRWLVTASLAGVLETRFRQEGLDQTAAAASSHNHHQQHSGLPPFVELFHLRNWLRLSDRVFMNSGVEDGNWRCVAEAEAEVDGPPAIRATALADFYSLTLSITRRLVSAALYVASSRIRMKRAVDPTRHSALVKKNDVWAAAASIGLKEGSREFWAKAARRLRLDVFDDDDEYETSGEEDDGNEDDMVGDEDQSSFEEREGRDMDVDTASKGNINEEDAVPGIEEQQDQEDDYEIMSYDAVEAALSFPNSSTNTISDSLDEPGLGSRSGFNIPIDSDSDSLSETSETNDPDPDPDPDPDIDQPSSPPIDSALLSADLTEALTYSALDHIPTSRSKQALTHRLKAEQRLWADADALDAAASAAEEARLWAMLRGDPAKPETESPKPDPGPALLGLGMGGSGGSSKRSVLEDQGENWRDRMEYYSAWELTAERNRLQGYND